MRLRVSFVLALPLTLVTACLSSAQEGQVRPPGSPDLETTKPDAGRNQAGQPVQQPQSQPTTFEEGGGNAWFEKTKLYLGTFYEEEEAVGTFRFKNPDKQEHKFTGLTASCTCAKAILKVGDRVYHHSSEGGKGPQLHRVSQKNGVEERDLVSHITIGPEESGTVEVHMKMAGHQGDKDANIQLQTSDEKLPAISLNWRATGAVYFLVDPPDISLNEMTWQDKRVFTFRVTSPLKPDFNLVTLENKPPKAEVKFEKELKEGRAVWTVTGTYGPNLEEKDGGGEISIKSDAQGKVVKMRFAAFVKGPLKQTPSGFVSCGAIRQGTEGKFQVYFWPTDGFELDVTKVEFVRLDKGTDPNWLSSKVSKGVKYKDPLTREETERATQVEIVVSKDAPKRAQVRGTVRIHLNHPKAPVREIDFNGFIR